MTRTQFYTATSLDGFIADENNSLDWLFEVGSDSEVGSGNDGGPGSDDGSASAGGSGSEGGPGDRFASFLADVGAMTMGRTTYEWILAHERLLEQPDKWRASYGDRPTWVFTHREVPPIPGADIRVVAGDIRPVHRDLVDAAAGQNVWLIGGGELVGQFADAGLLDDVIVNIAPVFLGRGAPLLPRRLTGLRLTGTEVLGGAMVELRYTLPDRLRAGDDAAS